MECTQRQNMSFCTCTYEPCPRKGRCCECLLYHRGKGQIPGCFFPTKIEKDYDRSIKAFVACHRV